LHEIQAGWGISIAETVYIGDDWNDLPAFEAAGVKVAVANAADLVKQRADYITERTGGQGAVREVIDLILARHIAQEKLVENYLNSLIIREDSQTGAQ